MKKKLVLKPFVVPTIFTLTLVIVIISLFFSIKIDKDDEIYTYVSKTILDEYVPVIKTQYEHVSKPFMDNDVIEVNSYYEIDEDSEKQENAVLKHDNLYLQNTGINYSKSEEFDIISVLDGEVIDVNEKELLGKSVTIKHNNELISVYQCLNSVNVKIGDKVINKEVIGKSGSCEIMPTTNNNLHFEIYVNGLIANPENYFGKEIR